MDELTLIEFERQFKPEPLSYFEHNAQRTLPRDKEMQSFHRDLHRHYLAAELEHQVRKFTQSQRIPDDLWRKVYPK